MVGKFQFILVWGGKNQNHKNKKMFFLLISDKSEIKNNPLMQLGSIVQNS